MQYFFSCPKGKDREIIRDFLLENSDTVDLTEIEEKVVSWLFLSKKDGGKSDKRFLRTLDNLKEDFIKIVVNNTRFGGVEQFENDRYKHHYYKLSPNLKKLIIKDDFFPHYFGNTFYGFEDPVFYRNGVMIGSVTSHHDLFLLYLTNAEKEELKNKGLKFEDFEKSCECEGGSCNQNKTKFDWGCFAVLATIGAVIFFILFGVIKYIDAVNHIIFGR